ncbi:MAG: bacteriohemerythrin [Thermodesulfobacteriota bacterium]
MEILAWHKRFSVGNTEIDLQHKMLINIINYLITGSGKNYSRSDMEEILEELVQYCQYHFSCEENFLKDHPEIEDHRILHADFMTRMQAFESSFKKHHVKINDELLAFLINWIRDHILKNDVAAFSELAGEPVLS